MKKLDDDEAKRVTEEVRRLAKAGEVYIAESSRIDRHPYEDQKRFVRALGGPSRFMATDLSTVSDFFHGEGWEIARRKAKELYGMDLEPRTLLVDCLDQLRPHA